MSSNINKKTFCILPWINLATTVNGRIRTCGYAKNTSEVDQPHLSMPIMEAWNTEYFKSIRKAFLNGEKHSNCNRCFYMDEIGGLSKRQIENKTWEDRFDFDQLISETKNDGSLLFGPKILDLRTENTCNLKCIICTPGSSSKWSEDKQLDGKYQNTIFSNSYNIWKNEEGYIWKYIEENYKDLTLLSLLGGEPLAAKSHKKLLDFLSKHSDDHEIELRYVTNGTLITDDIIEKWSKLKHVCLSISVDAIGGKNDYLRFPANWNETKAILKKLNQAVSDNLFVQILWTGYNMNIYYADETFDYIKNEFPNIYFAFGDYVDWPIQMNCQNLPQPLKEEIVTRLKKYDFGTRQDNLNFFITHMLEKDLWSEHGETLKSYLNDLDNIRGCNWQETFPELKDFLC